MIERETLVEMREYIARGWCQHDCAQNSKKEPVFFNSPDICFVCLTGALYLVHPHLNLPTFHALNSRLEKILGVESIGAWNDAPGRTQGEVLELLDTAIARLT